MRPVQSYNFPKTEWTLKTARSWCEHRNGCNPTNCKTVGNFIHCTQFDSSKCIPDTYSTITAESRRTANLAGRRKPKHFNMVVCEKI